MTKTTATVPVPATSTVTLDPGSAYQLLVQNTGTVMVGLGADDMQRAAAAQDFILSARTGTTANAPDYGDGVVTFPPGVSRWIYPAGPVTAQNPSTSAGSVTVSTWSP